METINFVAWVVVIGGIAIFAIAVMVRAYGSNPSIARFPTPVPYATLLDTPSDASSSEPDSLAASATSEPENSESENSDLESSADQPVGVDITEAAIALFQSGVSAFQSGQYRDAVDWFNQAIQTDNTFAEAFHNRGLALANLKKDNEAVRSLVQASEAYALRDRPDGIQTVKQHLQQLAA
jgi:tetratricopeptide (TPR) repeat protein